jgi:hypothetical protein
MQNTPLTLDKATILVLILIIVTEIIKQPQVQAKLVRPGPQPNCPDEEIITIALYQELLIFFISKSV